MITINIAHVLRPNTTSIVFSAVISLASAFAIAGPERVHTDKGGSASSQTSTSATFKLANQNQSRAEYQYRDVGRKRSGGRWVNDDRTFSLSGRMKIDRWNRRTEAGTDSDRISIIQVLNNTADNSTSGGSNPVSQLTLRKVSASSNTLGFWVIYGGGAARCGSLTTTEGSSHNISVSFKRGSSPAYYIDGTKCQKSPADNDRPGRIGSSDSGKFFYAKLGAYVTGGSSNRYGASGNGVWLKWSSISDY